MACLDPISDAATSKGNVLLIDDDRHLRTAYGRILRQAGFTVAELADGRSVAPALAAETFDVVISDIRLVDVNGIEVLRAAHALEPELPVVLMTGDGDLKSAMEAIELGALRYLTKPIAPSELRQIAEVAVNTHAEAKAKRHKLKRLESVERADSDRADLSARFDRALASVQMAFQPIVRWSDRSTYAFEALVRNSEPTMRAPDVLFAAAEELDRLHELGRAIRREVANTIASTGSTTPVFVNLHPRDLEDEELYSASAPLSKFAGQVVLEITERASLGDVSDFQGRLARLRERGSRLALDDLGAGYAGLSAFAQLRPDVVKLDMSLVRGVDQDVTKQRLVEMVIGLCSGFGILVVTEGIETAQERDTLVRLGCDLLQGYHFARPGPAFPAVPWSALAGPRGP
ncbi:MAG: EAL domain-containing response regulator [Myxococcaceae bacterium]|nr:EAL domain-containing response regulator [Myxococcaceae bacterium]